MLKILQDFNYLLIKSIKKSINVDHACSSFPPNLSQVCVEWLSICSMTRFLDIIKVLHFAYLYYKVSYLSIHPSHFYSVVVTNNSLFLPLCSLRFASSLDHLILRWINSSHRWINSRHWIIFFILVMSSLSVFLLFSNFLLFNFCQLIF